MLPDFPMPAVATAARPAASPSSSIATRSRSTGSLIADSPFWMSVSPLYGSSKATLDFSPSSDNADWISRARPPPATISFERSWTDFAAPVRFTPVRSETRDNSCISEMVMPVSAAAFFCS